MHIPALPVPAGTGSAGILVLASRARRVVKAPFMIPRRLFSCCALVAFLLFPLFPLPVHAMPVPLRRPHLAALCAWNLASIGEQDFGNNGFIESDALYLVMGFGFTPGRSLRIQ